MHSTSGMLTTVFTELELSAAYTKCKHAVHSVKHSVMHDAAHAIGQVSPNELSEFVTLHGGNMLATVQETPSQTTTIVGKGVGELLCM